VLRTQTERQNYIGNQHKYMQGLSELNNKPIFSQMLHTTHSKQSKAQQTGDIPMWC